MSDDNYNIQCRTLQRWCHTAVLTMLCASSGCAFHRTLPAWLESAVTLDGQMLSLSRTAWAGFRNPETTEATGLFMLEPYQRGQVPVVLIHGLTSDPLTWERTIEELRADQEIAARYQFWIFRYSTGHSYLKAAAELRQELYATLQRLDPTQSDAAFDNTVLIGHSMGGLIAKLQIASSGSILWDAVSTVPITDFPMDDVSRIDVEAAMVFEPVPFVRDVVFIATPHNGSSWAKRPIAKAVRKLIAFPDVLQADYSRLIHDGEGFLKEPSTKLPTSVEHLSPDNSVLQATRRLPLSPDVRIHSIIGTGHRLPDLSQGDGIVAISSAHLEGVSNEYVVKATHNRILRTNETMGHLRRILVAATSSSVANSEETP